MDPEFGDDLLKGFSDFSDNDSPSEGEDPQPQSLDLLSAMLETSATKKEKKKKPKAKRRPAPAKQLSSDKESSEQVSVMRAEMEAMQAELKLLRQQVANQSLPRKQPLQTSKTSGAASNKSPLERIINGERVRVAHQTSAGHSVPARQCDSPKPPSIDRDLSSKLISQRSSDNQEGVVTEKFSGLRIKNPLISSQTMTQRMEGRKMVRIPCLASRAKGGDIEGDWVTVGVIVDKLPPRESKKGDKYSVWKLSDLSGQSAVVTVFMFGQAYQEHWKTPVGHVVALLNPNVMPGREGASKDLALSLDHPKRLMLIGVAQDYTTCKATTKSGQKCTNFANTTDGGYCDYHTQHAYSRSRAARMECQNGYGPKSGTLQDKLFKGSKTDVFFAEGRTFVASGGKSKGTERLFVPGAKQSANQAMAELREQRGGVTAKRGVVTQEGSDIFKQMLQKQSIGARMLTKHLQKEEVTKKEVEGSRTPEKSALQLLKAEHHTRTAHSPVLGRGFGPGAMVELTSPKLSLAKRRAVGVVREKGGVVSETEESKQCHIVKRVQENRDLDSEDGPLNKKPRLDTERMDRILNAKSSHDWINNEVELDRELEYFERLEKKENIDLKRQSIKELKVTVVHCKQCGYTAEYPGELCKKQSHPLTRQKAVKRCYQCKGCKERHFTYTNRCPLEACAKCGGNSYEQVSLFKERKGPALPTEQLKLRGDEEKYLNSLR